MRRSCRAASSTSAFSPARCGSSSPNRPAAGAALNGGLIRLNGSVAEREFLGEFIRYVVKVGATEIIADQAHYTEAHTFAPGEAVNLGIQPAQIRVLLA